jgi:hypothetical protein
MAKLVPYIALNFMIYMTYLVTIHYYQWRSIIFGFMLQQILLLHVDYKNAVRGNDFWFKGMNILDLCRFISQVIYLVCGFFFYGESMLQTNAIAVMQFLAYVGLLKYLRFVPKISIYVYFLFKAIEVFWYMFLVLFLISFGFSSAFLFKAQ